MRKLLVEEMGRLSVEEFKEAAKFPYLVILNNLRSLNNVGSFFRTADAFKASKLVLGGYTPNPPHREISKSALGAENSVTWEKVDDLVPYLQELKKLDYIIVAVEQVENSLMLQDFLPDPTAKYAFIFGNEVDGVSESLISLCDICLEIPQFGTKHSLNVSISAGIVLWSFISKRIMTD